MWFPLPLLWSWNLINVTEGSFSKLFHMVPRFPKVQVPSCLLRNVRNFQLRVKGGSCFPPKGLGTSAQRGETLQQDHRKEQRFPQVGKVQIFGLFFCRKKMFQLAYLFCFNSVCSLCLAGLGDGDLGFGAHLCAWMKSECACLEGNVLLVLLAVTLLLLIERSLLWLTAEITGIFNGATDSPWRGIKNTEGKILR